MRPRSSKVELPSTEEDPGSGAGMASRCDAAGMQSVGLLRMAQGEGG